MLRHRSDRGVGSGAPHHLRTKEGKYRGVTVLTIMVKFMYIQGGAEEIVLPPS